MSRTAVPVSKVLLQQVIKDVEAQKQFMSRAELWVAVAEEYNKQAPNPISSAVVYCRVKEWGLSYSTGRGRRGRRGNGDPMQTGGVSGGSGELPRWTPAGDRMGEHLTTFKSLEATTKPKYHGLIKLAQQGSVKAAIALKCLDCCGGSGSEVIACRSFECALYPWKPERF